MAIQKTITPIDNSIYLERPLASENEINKILDNAKSSFIEWRNTSIDERIIVINKFIDNLLALKEEISKEICWQIGRPISQCGNELRGFEERSRHMVNIAKTSLENIPARKNDEFDNYIYKSPLGVIFVMAPWNYPVITATNTSIPKKTQVVESILSTAILFFFIIYKLYLKLECQSEICNTQMKLTPLMCNTVKSEKWLIKLVFDGHLILFYHAISHL